MTNYSRNDLRDIAWALFERPTEPLFKPRGDRGIFFEIPDEFILEKFRPMSTQIKNRLQHEGFMKITIRPSAQLPTFNQSIMEFPRRENFSLFIPYHRQLAGDLINIFMGMGNYEGLLTACAAYRDRINPELFNYALSVSLLHRNDTKNVDIPLLSSIFPDKFFDGGIFAQAREESNLIFEENVGDRPPLRIPQNYTATDLELEHRLAYFREDIGINLHHWHWHLVYPLTGPREIVNKDRRGELFYYMHQQIVARYDFDRMCNRLPRVKRLMNLNEPIEEGYFPKLDSLIASRVWVPRASGAILRDIDREVDQLKFDIQDLERWRTRLFDAIHLGRADGTTVPLTIDMLGNMVEASPLLSPNYAYYGDLHNFGHVAISLQHDLDQRHLETFSVMGDSATAMRDPVFYRWHAFVNDIFVEYKNTQPRYTAQELTFTNVRVTNIEVVTPNAQPQSIQTFWQESAVDLSRGLDFNPRGTILVTTTHLQHMPFQYNITVENSGAARMGTVRIFLSPKLDERGQEWRFIDQRHLFIEMDRFPINLRQGSNVINRQSRQSSVTIPFEQVFRPIDVNRPPANQQTLLDEFNFCGCGWPEHMLVPKGDAAGFECTLFVMISDYKDDMVGNQPPATAGSCQASAPYCGLNGQLYPDRRSMGFPFDRLPQSGITSLRQFLTPNMGINDLTIRFTNRVVPFDLPRNRGPGPLPQPPIVFPTRNQQGNQGQGRRG